MGQRDGPITKLKRPPKGERHRPYWKAMVVADVASLGVGALTVAMVEPLEPNSYFSYHGAFLHAASMSAAIAVPAVHWGHNNGYGGFSSLALRIAMPPLTSLVGVAAACLPYAMVSGEFADRCGKKGAAFGYLAGYLGSLVIDYGSAATLRRPEPGKWYGWQIAIIDGVALGLSAGVLYQGYRNTGAFPGEVALPVVGIMGATIGSVGSPIVHLAHRNWLRAFLGLGVRFAGVIVGTAATVLHMCAASGAEGDRDQECLQYGALSGTFIGYSVGAAADIAFFARKKRPEQDDVAALEQPRERPWKLFPAVMSSRDGTMFGAGVRF